MLALISEVTYAVRRTVARPLDSKPMAPALPGVFELRDDDKDAWYRVLYTQQGGVVHVLHCFRKKTRKTPPADIEITRKRLSALRQRLLKQKKTGDGDAV